MLVAIFRSILRDRTQSKLGQLRGDWQPRQMLFSLRSMPSQIYSVIRKSASIIQRQRVSLVPRRNYLGGPLLNIKSASVATQEGGRAQIDRLR